MRISSTFSDYVKAADLQGRTATVTIASVSIEEIGKDRKPVVYFRGKEKGMVLNKTNANTISALYGDETDNWVNQPVTLYVAWVDFQGKSVEAIRVRAPQGQQPQQQAQAPQSSPVQPKPVTDLDQDIPF